MVQATVKLLRGHEDSTKLNLLRATASPLVKLIPSLRMLIVAVSQSVKEPSSKTIERWG